MAAAEFTDPRLARIYDDVCNPRADLDFYTALAGTMALRVLDLCCGTGQLATMLVARGHRVTGVDTAAAMLDVARARRGGERVTWIEADARTLVLAASFDLVVLSGHAFQAFLSDADVDALFCSVRTVLAPGGRLAFETRNPLVRAWEGWTPAASRRRVSLAAGGAVVLHAELHRVVAGLVDSSLHYRFMLTGEEAASRQVLRFPSREDVASQLAHAGVLPQAWYGDWDATPLSEQCPEIIVVAGPPVR